MSYKVAAATHSRHQRRASADDSGLVRLVSCSCIRLLLCLLFAQDMIGDSEDEDDE